MTSQNDLSKNSLDLIRPVFKNILSFSLLCRRASEMEGLLRPPSKTDESNETSPPSPTKAHGQLSFMWGSGSPGNPTHGRSNEQTPPRAVWCAHGSELGTLHWQLCCFWVTGPWENCLLSPSLQFLISKMGASYSGFLLGLWKINVMYILKCLAWHTASPEPKLVIGGGGGDIVSVR